MARKPSKKQIVEKLRERRVFNAHNFAEHGEVYIGYDPGDRWQGARVQVVRPGFKTDSNPKAHWQDRGHKTFDLFGIPGDTKAQQRDAAIEKAKEWAGQRYGITEWAKTPFDTWMDKGYVERRLAELLADPEQAESQ